jgi:hypothetical protein
MAAAAGVGAFVGSALSPEDEAAKQFGVTLFQAMVEGASVCEAVQRARNAALPRHRVTALSYVLSGYPELRRQSS